MLVGEEAVFAYFAGDAVVAVEHLFRCSGDEVVGAVCLEVADARVFAGADASSDDVAVRAFVKADAPLYDVAVRAFVEADAPLDGLWVRRGANSGGSQMQTSITSWKSISCLSPQKG